MSRGQCRQGHLREQLPLPITKDKTAKTLITHTVDRVYQINSNLLPLLTPSTEIKKICSSHQQSTISKNTPLQCTYYQKKESKNVFIP